MSFVKPTKLKLLLFLLIWITLWSSIRIEELVHPIAFKRAFPEMSNYIEEAAESDLKEYKEELAKVVKKINDSIDSDTKIIRKAAVFVLTTFLPQALPCYLCSCLVVFLTKKRLTKEIANS